jgi:hypothetical protein
MALLVWVTLGVALWHFTVFVPDRFRGGIVGAFAAAVIGSMITGAIWQLITGDSLGQTNLLTAFAAVPGFLIATSAVYALGVRDERQWS